MRRHPLAGGTLLIAGSLLVAVVPMLSALADPDLWWHLRLGHLILDTRAVPHQELFSYTAAGNDATFHEWGSEVLFALLDTVGGLVAVTLVTCLLAWTGLVALAIRCRDRGVHPLAVAAAVLLAAKTLQPVSGPRPQMLGFALLCWTLLLVERHLSRGGRTILVLPAVFLLWANVHGGFVIGLALVGLLVGIEAVRAAAHAGNAPSRATVRSAALAWVLATLACCLNPAGPRLFAYTISSGRTEARKPISEWQSPDFHDPGSWPLLLLIVLVVVLAAVSRGPGLRDGLLAAVGIAAALVAVRNIELAVALAVVPLALLADGAVAGLPRRPRLPQLRRASVLLLLGASAAVAAVGVARLAADASSDGVARAYPACAAAVLAAEPGEVRVDAPYAESAFLIDRGWPHVRVYDYGESISLGTAVLDDFLRIASAASSPPSAQDLLDRSRTTAVLTPAAGALDSLLAASGAWHLRAVDHGRDLWLRGPSGDAVTHC